MTLDADRSRPSQYCPELSRNAEPDQQHEEVAQRVGPAHRVAHSERGELVGVPGERIARLRGLSPLPGVFVTPSRLRMQSNHSGCFRPAPPCAGDDGVAHDGA